MPCKPFQSSIHFPYPLRYWKSQLYSFGNLNSYAIKLRQKLFYGKKLMQSQQNPLKNVAIWYCRSFNRNIALSLEITSISDCVCSLINKFSSNGRDDELTISHSTCELKKEIEMLKIKLLHELPLICSLFFILRSINLSHFLSSDAPYFNIFF